MVDACHYSINGERVTKKSYIELELLNKDRILLHSDAWSKIYSLAERSQTKMTFSKKFPFVAFKKSQYVTFKLRTVYEYINSIVDPRYKVNCTLREFANLFGRDVVPFEETIMNYNIYQQ